MRLEIQVMATLRRALRTELQSLDFILWVLQNNSFLEEHFGDCAEHGLRKARLQTKVHAGNFVRAHMRGGKSLH